MDPTLSQGWTPSLTHDLWVGLGVLTAGVVLALEKRRRGVDDDRIWALEGGRIIEAGTHDELVDNNGLYTALWRVQTGTAYHAPT